MILIENNSATVQFKKGPFANDAQACIRLVMEMLNLSKSFSSVINKGQRSAKKMNKTGRIRIGIQKFVNKDGVTPLIVDKLIGVIRNGNLKEVKVQAGDNEIMLYPNYDVPGVIAELMIKKVI